METGDEMALRNYVDLHIVEATGNVRAVLEDIDHILQDSEALYASPPTAPGMVSVPRDELSRIIRALDAIYNHNEAARSAVIQYYGLHHHPAMLAVASKESATGQEGNKAPVTTAQVRSESPVPAADPQMPT